MICSFINYTVASEANWYRIGGGAKFIENLDKPQKVFGYVYVMYNFAIKKGKGLSPNSPGSNAIRLCYIVIWLCPSYLKFKSLKNSIFLSFFVRRYGYVVESTSRSSKISHWWVEAKGCVKKSSDWKYLTKHHPFDEAKFYPMGIIHHTYEINNPLRLRDYESGRKTFQSCV